MGKISQLSYQIVVQRHYRKVFQVANALLNDRAEAEDVTQDTFTKFWQDGDSILNAKHWLLRVTRNECLDRLRKSARVDYVEDDQLPTVADHRDAVWHLHESEQNSRLHRAIANLPEPQRSLIVLFSLRGLSGADCARVLELNENQVKVYLHRARARLRELMECEHE
jgi:RNA polymerase sigma-70 factor (ECF subfamily)